MAGRRLLLLLAVLTAIGLPAGVLRAACVGRSCGGAEDGLGRVPFCPLPADVRTAIGNGYREGRSPDVLIVAEPGADLAGPERVASGPVRWPSVGDDAARVPLAFAGAGVDGSAEIPEGTTLDRVAPTVADIVDVHRPHPHVRSGTAIAGVAGDGSPRLVVLVAWSGVGTDALERDAGAWPWLRRATASGAATFAADPGSIPLDPAAVLTTIGTGGLPFQHGITSSLVRNDVGDPVPAFASDAPLPIIASLAEDVDEQSSGAAFVGLVAPRTEDRGLIGGGWYLDPPDRDDDQVVIASGAEAARSAERMLHDLETSMAGTDEVIDVVGVVLEGGVRSLDRRTSRIAAAAGRATGGRALIVVAGTGDAADPNAVDAGSLIDDAAAGLPGGGALVDAVVPGGVFVDGDVLAREGVTGQTLVDTMLSLDDDAGRPIVRDAFQGFAVSFARYC